MSADEKLFDTESEKENVSQFKGVYDDTLHFVDGLSKKYDYYPEALEVMRGGNAKIELRKRYMLKAIDEQWVERIEDAIPALDMILRNPTKFIEENEIVLPIELSRNITNRSIRHLTQHTDYIAKVEGDKITPSKILNIFRDETMLTYENKFVNTLVNRLYLFVARRYETAVKEGKDEKNTSLDFSENFTHGEAKGKIHLRLELSEEPDNVEELKNYTYTTDLWLRVERLFNICSSYMSSVFVKGMGQNYVRPPIVRTNAILKNKNLRQCLELWEFIESYDNIGYNMLVEEHLEEVDQRYISEVYSSSALQYLIFRYNIRNEFENDKSLSEVESSAPFSPTISDELKTVNTKEFDKVYSRNIPMQGKHGNGDETLSRYDKKVLRAVDVALMADNVLRRETKRRPLPKRNTVVQNPLTRGVRRIVDRKIKPVVDKKSRELKKFYNENETHIKNAAKLTGVIAEEALLLGIVLGSRSKDKE